ncbi:unnamed protein product [Rhizoctonia solani]|uniref:L-type lectin-like domain-containing protein n=1 Tax=Rhizoctonia solani TaxID=456999 RepID=A0A8H2ZWK2_9AGAM|nr:unnamed protein product [Rhizoctonia solani]
MWTGLNLAATLILLAAAGTNAQQKVRKNHTIDQTVPLRTHSIYAPYVDQDLQNRWFSFGGNAYVNTNKHIRVSIATLTINNRRSWRFNLDYPGQTVSSRMAMVPSTLDRVKLRNRNRIQGKRDSKVISLYFLTHRSQISGSSSHLYGDGLAIWLTDTRAELGPVFGSVDKFVGLGVFIDTYANSRHTYAFPRIMAMLGDGKTAYDVGNDGASNELAACSANIRKTDIATKLKLTYFKDEYLNVQLQYKGWDEWTECFTVYDVSLPNTPYLGFTAHTGDISDNHDIISVSTSSAILTDAPINMPTKKSSSSSGFWTFLSFLVKLAGVSLVGVAALAGYRAYARNAKRRGGFGGIGGGMPHWDNKHF